MDAITKAIRETLRTHQKEQLLTDVIDQGRKVRAANEKFVVEGKKALLAVDSEHRAKHQHLREGVNKRAAAIVAVCGQTSTTSTEPLPLVAEYLHAQKALVSTVKADREAFEALQASPPGREALDQSIERFNQLLALLDEAVAPLNVRVPWQVRQCGSFDPDAPNAQVPIEGGKITDAEGNNIWAADCYMCGGSIQDGSKGEGDPRLHCLDCPRSWLCLSCAFTQKQVLASLKDFPDAIKELASGDAHYGHELVQQTNIDIFQRFPVGEAPNLALALYRAMCVYGPRSCFGTKTTAAQVSDDKVAFSWTTYSQIQAETLPFASGLSHLLPTQGSVPFVGICGPNEPRWLEADFACVFNSFTSVGIHLSWPIEEIIYVINNAKLRTVVCTPHMIRTFLTASASCPSLEFLVSMDDTIDPALLESTPKWKQTQQTARLLSWKDVVAASTGKTRLGIASDLSLKEVPPECVADDALEAFTLFYSSGTTGRPKGIVASKKSWRQSNVAMASFELPNVVASYSALAHGMDRGMVWAAIFNGGKVGFVENEAFLLPSLASLRPPVFIAMPYFWTALYNSFIDKLERSTGETARAGLLADFKAILGGRIVLASTGGSGIAPEVFEWMKEFLGCTVTDSYGTTETPGITTNGKLRDGVKLKLRDVPELGFTSADKPWPRGEICVRTPEMASGYFNAPEETAKAFDAEGFFHTGDVGELNSETNELRIIDRMKNMIELYIQGRSVYVSSLEVESAILGKCKGLQQVYLNGDRMEEVLLAVVVPSPTLLTNWQADPSKVEQTLLEELNAAIQLLSAARVGGVIVESSTWTAESGLVTANHKNVRTKLFAKYKLAFDLLYARLKEPRGSPL